MDGKMECNTCHTEMACQPRMDVTYHECPSCGGLWFNSGELEGLIASKTYISLDRGESIASPPEGRPSEECPHCGHGVRLVAMTGYAASKARVLGCPVCFGRWLSRREARTLIRNVCFRGPFGWIRRLFR